MVKVKAFLLVVMVFLVMFSVLPLVSADYMVSHASFPPDFAGDINYDGIVDMRDVRIAGAAYMAEFGDANWDSRADVNDGGLIDMKDIRWIASFYLNEYEYKL